MKNDLVNTVIEGSKGANKSYIASYAGCTP